MAEWIAEGEPEHRPLGDGRAPLRRRTTARPPTRTQRIRETYETYYDIRYPEPRARGRAGRCGSRAANAWHREHDAAFGEKSGWERVNWYESNAAAGDESLRPRGWAGQHWSPAIGAEHLRDARGGRDLRRVLVREDGDRRARARPSSSSACATTAVARERREDHLHADAQPPRRDRVRLHRRAPRRGAVLDRHRHRVRQPRPRVDPPRTCPTTARSQVRDVTSAWACFGIWGPRARDDPRSR